MPLHSLYLREELLNFCIVQSMKRKITTSEYIKKLILEEYKKSECDKCNEEILIDDK